MRAAVAACLACLPFDPLSRRALDETLRDWAHESERADSAHRRGLVYARSLAGVVRAVVQTIGLEVSRIPAGRLVPQLLLVTACPAALLAVTGWGHVPVSISASWLQRLELGGFVLPQAALAMLPLSLFVVVARSSAERAFPSVGLATMALVSVLVLTAWVLPAANRAFHIRAYSLHTHNGPAAAERLPFAPNDLGPLDLLARAIDRPAGPPMGVLLFRTGLALTAGAFVLLGSAVAQGPRSGRRSRVWSIAAAYAMALVLLPSSWELGGHAPAVVGLLPWCGSGLALLYSVTLQRTQQGEGVVSCRN